MDSQILLLKNLSQGGGAKRSDEEARTRPRQFSLRIVFVWMVFAAVQMAAVRVSFVLALNVPPMAAALAAWYFRRGQPQRAGRLSTLCGVFWGFELLAIAWFCFDQSQMMTTSKTKKAKIELSCIKTQLGTFQMEVGRYPTQAEGLLALETRPPSVPASKWCGPYPDGGILPLDPWGRPYVYQFQLLAIVLSSHGPDGRPATKDDVQVRFMPYVPLQPPSQGNLGKR